MLTGEEIAFKYQGSDTLIFIEEEQYKNSYGIYAIKNISNNKIYIGQTKEKFIRRFWHHRWKLNNNQHDNNYLQNSFNKHGEDKFIFYIIYCANENDDLNELEKSYIVQYNTIKDGYNIQSGGQELRLCDYISEEARKIVGMKNKEHMTGKRHSDATKEKMSKVRKGSKNAFSKLTEKDVKQIKIRLKNGDSPTQIAKDFNITYGNIKMIRSEKTWKHVQI